MAKTKAPSEYIARIGMSYGPDSRYSAEPGDVVKAIPDNEAAELVKVGFLEVADPKTVDDRRAEIRAAWAVERFEVTVDGPEARALGKANRERLGLVEEAVAERPVEAAEPPREE